MPRGREADDSFFGDKSHQFFLKATPSLGCYGKLTTGDCLDLNRNFHNSVIFRKPVSRMFGIGRVYYNSLGHEEAFWNDPRYQEMLLKAIKWVRGEGD